MGNKLWNILQDLKSAGYEWIELSHSLNNDSPYWSGIPEGSVELGKVVFDWGNPMLECLIQTFTFPGQFGTHVDFPAHFIKNAPFSEQYGANAFIFPLAVIDISGKVQANVDYAVTEADVKAYEEEYGPIPEGAFVALRTDWHKRWPDMEKMANIGKDGNEHCPGWSLDALKYIFEVRKAAANGHETLDTDASYLAVQAGDLACERYVLQSGKLQIEMLTNLDKVAPAGAVLFASWPRIEGATGLPARVYAFTPKKQ